MKNRTDNNEIWKDIYFEENGVIYDYIGSYQVSNMGRVKSLKFYSNANKKYYDREKILKSSDNKKGYLYVSLCKNKKIKYFYIHRLVAYMFIQNPNKFPEINHKNEDKTCNEYWNLEWCSCKYNNNYGTHKQRISKRVNQYDKQGNYIKTWDSLSEVGRELGINVAGISRCCKGYLKTTKGYKWRYANEG